MDPNSYEISYSPSADYNGSGTLTYDLGDEDGLTDTGAIALIVWPVNDLPLFSGGPLQRDVARRAPAGDDVGSSVTAWVADSGQDQLFAWVSQSGERHEAREFELAERNRDPRGIWADGDVIYVLDSVKDALFVYDLETADLLAEHALGKLSRSPRGLWSDGVTLWVSDDGAERLFAYEFDDGALSSESRIWSSRSAPCLRPATAPPAGSGPTAMSSTSPTSRTTRSTATTSPTRPSLSSPHSR